jgi:hypothetical protein
MIGTWLELPVIPQILLLAAVYLITGTVMHLLSFHGPMGRWVRSFRGIVGPFFTSVTVIFALLAAFIANDVWRRDTEAAQIVRAEADALLSLYYLTPETAPDAAVVHNRIRAYTESIIRQEWPRMYAGDGAPETEAVLDALFQEILGRSAGDASNSAIERARIDIALKLRTIRANRLSLAADRTDELRWSILLILAVMAQFAIAAVHLERPRPQIAALAIFSGAVVIALGLVAVQERPFVPPLEIPPTALEEVLRVIPAKSGGLRVIPRAAAVRGTTPIASAVGNRARARSPAFAGAIISLGLLGQAAVPPLVLSGSPFTPPFATPTIAGRSSRSCST